MNEQTEPTIIVGTTPMDLPTAIEYYQFQLEEADKQIARLQIEGEAAAHYKIVYEYVINLDMQHEMLDLLNETDDKTYWAEFYNSLNVIDALRENAKQITS